LGRVPAVGATLATRKRNDFPLRKLPPADRGMKVEDASEDDEELLTLKVIVEDHPTRHPWRETGTGETHSLKH
jgi:hypothetical protein